MTTRIVIPARLQSTRLPRKVLADLAGEPVLSHVIRAAQSSGLGDVWVATDAVEVLDVADAAGARTMQTRADHPSGSDRINEVAAARGWAEDDVVVNLQGDEPFMPADLLRAVAEALEADEMADWATVACSIHSLDEFRNPACVKVVCDSARRALYFSRAPIPHGRDLPADTMSTLALRHIGLYAYRVGALARYCEIPPTPLEALEKLEQLRALESGMRIRVHVCENPPPPGIDTLEDLEAARVLIQSRR